LLLKPGQALLQAADLRFQCLDMGRVNLTCQVLQLLPDVEQANEQQQEADGAKHRERAARRRRLARRRCRRLTGRRRHLAHRRRWRQRWFRWRRLLGDLRFRRDRLRDDRVFGGLGRFGHRRRANSSSWFG
jgi:hypothetical protein